MGTTEKIVISWGFAVMISLKTSMSVKGGPPMATFDYWTARKTKRLQFARLGVGFEAAFQTMFIPIFVRV